MDLVELYSVENLEFLVAPNFCGEMRVCQHGCMGCTAVYSELP